MKLISFKINDHIDRIRGAEEIVISVSCKFQDGSNVTEVSGLGLCTAASNLNDAVKAAIENAKENLSLVSQLQASGPKDTEKISQLIRTTLSTKVALEAKKNSSNEAELKRMYEIVGEDKQQKISGLCEALGIDKIVINEWTNIEALVLITYLEKMTDPIAGV